jgi:hypothetical protein
MAPAARLRADARGGDGGVRKELAEGVGMSDRERELFFSMACDYYIAGRFAAFAGLNPVVGNLLHHAIEMYLKGALAKTKSLRELDKSFKHNLPKLWEAFKQQTNNAALIRFDSTISDLHQFEDIRYPDSILAKGMAATVEIVRSTIPNEYKGPAVPEYRVCVQDIDELVEAVFSAASLNPRYFFDRGQPLAREFLTRENRASRLTDGVNATTTARSSRPRGAVALVCMAALIVIALIVWLASAFPEPLPVPKPAGPGGSCPHGYTTSGSFCVPSQGAQDAIAKPANGTCPFGWTASGSYCLRSGSGL